MSSNDRNVGSGPTSAEWILFPPFPALYEQSLAFARAQLDETTFVTAFAKGQAMSTEEMAAYALLQLADK